MKKSFFVILFLLLTNISFALSTLPKNAYLRYNDNQKEVVILQQILNSDPETKIADSGVGSPGKETWFFGKLTEDALKKFQEKNDLEVTGKINFKTWEKLNEYVKQKNNLTKPSTPTKTALNNTKPITTEKSTNTQTEEKNIYLGDTSKNDYSQKEEAKPATGSKTLLNDSYLSNILGQYSSLLSPSTYFTSTPQLQTSSTYSASTPYYNPQTSSYQPSPVTTSGGSYPPLSSYSGPNTPEYYSQNLPFGGNNYSYNPYSQYFPTTAGDIRSAGQISGNRGDIGICQATMFAHATLRQGCKADSGDQQNNQRSASGVILSRTGVPAIPAVALPNGGSMGDAVEVKIIKTGQCKAFPLLDRGPAARIVAAGKCIDLTGSAIDILKGRTPCKTVAGLGGGTDDGDKVQYAIIPGEKIKPGEFKECKHLTN